MPATQPALFSVTVMSLRLNFGPRAFRPFINKCCQTQTFSNFDIELVDEALKLIAIKNIVV